MSRIGLADSGLSDSSSTAYLAHSGPFLVGGGHGHGRPQQRLQGAHHQQQQRYLPPIDTGHGGHQEKHERPRAFRSTFADPSEPIYTDPSLFERSRSIRSIQETAKLWRWLVNDGTMTFEQNVTPQMWQNLWSFNTNTLMSTNNNQN